MVQHCEIKMAAKQERDIDFATEGRLALEEVSFALLYGDLSALLPCTADEVYLNVTTRENAKFCVSLSRRGFQVVGEDHDEISPVTSDANVFETVYSLLERISPSYTKQFSNQLFNKLKEHSTNNQ